MGERARAGIFLALSAAGMLSVSYVAEYAPEWLGASWTDRFHVVAVLSFIVCALGMWQMQEATGWGRGTWRGRSLGLLVVPCYILPAWLGLFVLSGPFDANTTLQPRALPGYRISLPDWRVTSHSDDYWNGSLTLHRVGGESLVVRWSPFGDKQDLDPMLDELWKNVFHATPVAAAATTPAHTRYGKVSGWFTGMSARRCDDGRVLFLHSNAEKLDDERRFHERLLATIECSKETAPQMVYARFTPPEGFQLTERTAAGTAYSSGTESIVVSAQNRDMTIYSRLVEPRMRELLFNELVREAQAHVAGDGKLSIATAPEGERKIWKVPLIGPSPSVAGGAELVWSAWKCADQSWFWVAHIGRSSSPAVDRLLGASCP